MNDIYPYTLLYVEDEEGIRKNYLKYLKTLFNRVYEAKDGEEAYLLYKEKKPDIMIVDINMPKLNGIDLLQKIREKDHTLKAIMLTSYTDTEILLQSATLKLTKYLVKPIMKKELKEALELTVKELHDYKTFSNKKIILPENYYWDIELNCLFKYDNVVEITSKENFLLSLLFSYKNRVFSYDEISEYVWKEEDNSLNSLKNLVKRLRKKLPKNVIINIFNEGYKISF